MNHIGEIVTLHINRFYLKIQTDCIIAVCLSIIHISNTLTLMALPTYQLILQESSQNNDSSSLSIVHNLNMEEIAAYVNAMRLHLATLADDASTNITQAQFDALLTSAKKSVLLLAGMSNAQTIDFDNYQLVRVGVPAGYPTTAIEFRITDLDVARNTDFRQSTIIIKTFDGETVYPLIKSTLTYISIIFMDALDVATTQVQQSTDPNNKRIIIF